MTSPTADQFAVLTDREVLHRPSATTITFSRAQLWSDEGFSVSWSKDETAAPRLAAGESYDVLELSDAARELMRARAFHAAA